MRAITFEDLKGLTEVADERRGRGVPVPWNLRDLLSESQRETLGRLERLDWRVLFARSHGRACPEIVVGGLRPGQLAAVTADGRLVRDVVVTEAGCSPKVGRLALRASDRFGRWPMVGGGAVCPARSTTEPHERRRGMQGVPPGLEAQLTELQRQALRRLGGFGWGVRFVRRPPGQALVVVVGSSGQGSRCALLREDGQIVPDSSLPLR